MAFLNEISGKIVHIAQNAANKSKRAAETAKYNIAIRTEERNIKKCYAELGKLYFEELGTSASEPFTDICEKIILSKKNILLQNDKIAEIQCGKTDASHSGENEDDKADNKLESQIISDEE